jgi:hypothetical protein
MPTFTHFLDVAPSPDQKYVLASSNRELLYVYNPHRPAALPLLTVFVWKEDWIAWTKEGYYAATPGGEKLMGWTVNNGQGRLATFYPAERFRKLLHRPDVIRRVLELGSVAAALKAADAARRRKTQRADLDELLPPRVTLEVVATKGADVTLRVSATASGRSQPVTGLRLLLDGRPVAGKDGRADFGQGKQSITLPFTLTLPGEKASGPYKLAALARGPDTSAVSEAVEVRYVNAANLPVMHVLAVGIDQYKEKALELKAAVNDARAIADTFRKCCKGALFRDVTATTLLDDKADCKAVLNQLEALKGKVKPNDLVVVFFAGHGVKTKSGFFLLTADADTANEQRLAQTALSGTKLQKKLAALPCQVLLLLDACHAAAFGDGKLAKKGYWPATDDLTRELTDDEVGVAVLCAAMGHEKAQEPEDGHGLFTRAILEALHGGSDVPRNRHDHLLYVHHLHAFVFDEVSRLSGREQHPFLSLPWVVESFPLVRFAKAAGRTN